MALSRSSVVSFGFALIFAAGLSADRITAASPGDRTISFYHIHTQERLTVTYKKGGQYIPEAMKQIDWLMRDWRKNQAIKIDPNTIDLAWEMHAELGSKEPISVICGYRSQGTNEMLRRTVGGQASQSQHISGKAIDITFPDVPLKRIRYSALVRERGGVGYYPTSGIPFIHIDTARVRSWPRLPRYELALVFPDGRSRHQPAEGGSISPADVRVAQQKYRELAVQIADFHQIRLGLKAPTLVASINRAPQQAAEPEQQSRFEVASLTDTGVDAPMPAAAAPRKFNLKWEALKQAAAPKQQFAALTPPAEPAKPKLVAEPKMVDRPSRFTPAPSKADRGKLEALVQQAANMPMPKLIAGPALAIRPQKALAAAAATAEGVTASAQGQQVAQQVASLEPEKSPTSITDMSPDSLGNGWVQAPAFDEDHPEELAYRPFPLAPMLTETESIQDPQLAGLQHPDVAATLDALDDEGAVIPMKFRPGQQVAQVMWAQQFQGKAVHVEALLEIDRSRMPAGLENRSVKTSAR